MEKKVKVKSISNADVTERYLRTIERKSGRAVRPYRADGFVNLMNKYGTSKDTSEHYYFQPEPTVPDDVLSMFYEGNGLFAKIIDAPAEEALKKGFTLDGISDQSILDFAYEALDELDWEEMAMTSLKWARLFGGSIAVLLINDGRGLEEPLDWKSIKSIDDIRIYDRSVIQPDYNSMFSYDPTDPFGTRGSRLGMPEYYHITSRYGSFTVHDSRCLVFQNGILPENCTNSIYQLWGMPEYIRLRRAIKSTELAHESAPKMLDKSIQPIYKVKNLASVLSTDDGEEILLRRLQAIDLARGMLNSIAIDADGEDYDFKSFQFAGVSDIVDATCNYLSALTSIPQTILFGRSPAGMNSTGQSDMENYYNYVERIQKRMLRSNLRYLLSVIFQAGLYTQEVEEIPNIKIKFNSLWSSTEKEQTELEQQKAALQQTKAQTAQVYVDMGAIDPTEIRQKLADSEEFNVETILDDYSDDELFDNMPQQEEQENAAEPKASGKIFEQGDFNDYAEGNSPDAAPEATKLPQDMDVLTHSDSSEMDGGPGSGNFGHEGREGKIGGSISSGKSETKSNGNNVVKFKRPTYEEKEKAFSDMDYQAIFEELYSKYMPDIFEAEKKGDKETVYKLQAEWDEENLKRQSAPLKILGTYMEEGYYIAERDLNDPVAEVFCPSTVNKEAGCHDMHSILSSNGNENIPAFAISNSWVKLSKEEAKEKVLNSAQKFGSDVTFGGLSRSAEKVIQTYTYAPAVSSAMRKGEKTEQGDKLKEIMDNTASPERKVYRGVTGDFANKISNLKVGDTFTDKGFMSTSYDKEVANQFAGEHGVTMTINVPSGFGKSMSISSYSMKPDEAEVLLNAGSTLRIKSNNGKEIECEVIDSNKDGGEGSGNWGHEGVEGQFGGSAPGGGNHNRMTDKNGGYTSFSKEKKRFATPHKVTRDELDKCPDGSKVCFEQDGKRVTYQKDKDGTFTSNSPGAISVLSASEISSKLSEYGTDASIYTPDSASPNYSIKRELYAEERKSAAPRTETKEMVDSILRRKTEKIWQEADDFTKDSLYSYTGNGYHEINSRLREGTVDSSEYIKKRVDAITDSISKSKLEKDMWLTRGMSDTGAASFLGISLEAVIGTEDFDFNSLVGKTVSDEGFMSCGSTQGAGMKNYVNYNIYCPAGTEALYAEPFSNFGMGKGRNWNGTDKQEDFSGEFETILQRGTKCRITKINKDKSGYVNVEMEVVSQKHKK